MPIIMVLDKKVIGGGDSGVQNLKRLTTVLQVFLPKPNRMVQSVVELGVTVVRRTCADQKNMCSLDMHKMVARY